MDITTYDNFEQQLLSEGEYVTILHGVSMYPMVRNCKDPVLIVPANSPLKPYDVAVYYRSTMDGESEFNRFVVHRVLECHSDCYVIRGDNCLAKEYVPIGDIAGKVSGFWRWGKFIPVTNPLYKIYSRIWVFINPLIHLRHFFLRCLRFAKKRICSLK